MQLLLDEIRNRRLARARETREPKNRRSMPVAPHPRLPIDREALHVDVGRPAEAEGDHPRACRRVVEAVDENEGARLAILRVRIERDRSRGPEIAETDLVE